MSIGLVGLAIALRVWPFAYLGADAPFLTFFPAIVAAAVLGGRQAGIIATALSIPSIVFVLTLIAGQPVIAGAARWSGLAVFGFAGLLVSVFAGMIFQLHEHVSRVGQERKRLDEDLRLQNELMRLRDFDSRHLKTFFSRSTEHLAETLQVDRVAIWLFNATGDGIECQDLYIRCRNRHESGALLRAVEFPRYFSALRCGEVVEASDARTHPATSEFSGKYLKRLGIASMLDVPIRAGSELVGIVCCEHVGDLREWRPEETRFVMAAAGYLMLAMRNGERLRAEAGLRRLNRKLERLVDTRTKALAESERQHRTLLDNLHGMAYRRKKDDSWALEFVSDGCRSLLGIAPEDLIKKRIEYLDLVHPDDIAPLRREFACAMAENREAVCEYRVVLPDGTRKWVLEKAQVVPSLSGGNDDALEGFVTDITDRKQMEILLRAVSVEAAGLAIDDFLRLCAQRVSEALNADITLIAQPGENPGTMQTRVVWVDGRLAENFSYTLEGSPCENVHGKEFCLYPGDVQRLFPHDQLLAEMGVEAYAAIPLFDSEGRAIGLIAALRRSALSNPAPFEPLLRLVGVRVAAELTRTAAEDALRRNERFARSVLDSLHAHIAVVDSTGEIVATNAAWRDFSEANGLPEGAADVGVNYLEVCDRSSDASEEAKRAAASIRAVIDGSSDGDAFDYLCHSDTEERWFKCRISRFVDSKPQYLVIAHEDISAVKLAQRSAEQNRRQLNDIFEHSPDGIVVSDADGVIVMVNRQAELLFGYMRSDLLGRPVETLVPAEVEGHATFRKEYLRAPRPYRMGEARGELKGKRKDGSLFPAAISLNVLETDGQKLVAATVRDLTAFKAAESDRTARHAAEEANRAKTNFLAAMSHEIRTPMNTIVGFAEVLAHEDLSPDQADVIDKMRDSADHLLGLIDDILDFSKIEADRIDLERAPMVLGDLLESAVRSLTEYATRRGVLVHLFVAPELPAEIYGDAVRLRQVVYNLLGNAIKFSSGRPGVPGRVELRAEISRSEPSTLQLTVSDNGIGMGRDVRERLFEPFSQGESSTTRRFGGTGLGLAICKRIVVSMRGKIAVTSEVGGGTSFTVTLPIESVAGVQDASSDRFLAGLPCLLVPGSDFVAEDIRAYLEHAGAIVQMHDDGDATHFAGAPCIVVEQCGTSEPNGGPRLLVRPAGGQLNRLSCAENTLLDINALRYEDLVSAVANVAGRVRAEDGELANAAAILMTPADRKHARARAGVILVVDDDAMNRAVMARQLALLGFQATFTSNGVEALKTLRDGKFALLLTDLHMPKMDGYELAKSVRRDEGTGDVANERRSRLPIIALTANALRDEVRRARESGMDEYLTKPISMARLGAALDRWLDLESGSSGSGDVIEHVEMDVRSNSMIDLTTLKEFAGGDGREMSALLRQYVEGAEQYASEIRAAAEKGDFAALILGAHKLKASSGWVGAKELAALCASLEDVGREENARKVSAYLSDFERQIADVIKAVSRVLDQKGGEPSK